ncbi:hypothetical protein MYSTI_04149 [Myxococcus stipitatus DSM 14675]|uniref:Uncharacterized protein n=1 Tax=Myxococcus stipitatus (strain DSM 14675 / JCM 12634 / Mx s8) TaxID=1278073 RepID=L7UGA1_MYXSD|nr:hypothetical protein [Myxococcus stipitatus]AGC45449.1 hypothetical protein MYSTI_04149 [Myxococcus stipitatus DSM 14675]
MSVEARADSITVARRRVERLHEDLVRLEAALSRTPGRRYHVAAVPECCHRAARLRWQLARAELALRATRLRAVNERMERIRRPRQAPRAPVVQLALFAAPADEQLPEAAPEDVVEVPEGARVLYLPRPTCPTAAPRLHILVGGAA